MGEVAEMMPEIAILEKKDNLKNLVIVCLSNEALLQKRKDGIRYCSILPLENRYFPCPFSGGLVDVREQFDRYRCFFSKT